LLRRKGALGRGGHSLKIKGASGLFNGAAFNGVGINHRGSYIAGAQQFLGGPEVEIRLQQVAVFAGEC
jgi:hypothetical protein